jgi:hypothetical protein
MCIALAAGAVLGQERAPSPTAAFLVRTVGSPTPIGFYANDARTLAFFVVGDGGEAWISGHYAAWSATAADVDGDSLDEVVVGMWSMRVRHDEPNPHRTVWVLGVEGGRLVERWRGSALARPLVDFRMADVGGPLGDELVSLERRAESCVLVSYTWNGFGFSGLGRVPVPCTTTRFTASECVEIEGERLCPRLEGGRLTLRVAEPGEGE